MWTKWFLICNYLTEIMSESCIDKATSWLLYWNHFESIFYADLSCTLPLTDLMVQFCHLRMVPLCCFCLMTVKKGNIQKTWGIKETSPEWTMNCNNINSSELSQVVNYRLIYLTRFICNRCLTTVFVNLIAYETWEVTNADKTTTTFIPPQIWK